MYRWLLFLLIVANVAVFVWGWRSDRPEPPPPLVEAPAEIRLLSELPAGAREPAAVREPTPAEAAAPVGNAAQPEPPPAPPSGPVSAYDGGAVRPPVAGPLPETTTEQVDPGLMPDELIIEPPVVIPPVREDEPPMHTWSR